MNKLAMFGAAIGAAVLVSGGAAMAQSGPTPQQIQGQIAAGQEQAALGELNTILQARPQSGVAWYLTAEAQDAAGNESAARDALNKAQQYAPGLPFAQPSAVAQLQAHLNAPSGNAPVTQSYAPAPAAPQRGFNPLFLLIGGVVLLFFLARVFMRRRAVSGGYPANYGPGYRGGVQGGPPYGPGGMPYGPGMGGGMGSGIGGSLIGGLAAGAGLAAGERVIDGMMGGGNAQAAEPIQEEPQVPERDDGLSGGAGWDDNSGGGGGFDPNNNW